MKKSEQDLLTAQLNATANMLKGMNLTLEQIKENMASMISGFEQEAEATLLLGLAPDGEKVEFQVVKSSSNFVRSRTSGTEKNTLRTLRAQFVGVNISVQVLAKGVFVRNEQILAAIAKFHEYVKNMPCEACEHSTADWPLALGSYPVVKGEGEPNTDDDGDGEGGEGSSLDLDVGAQDGASLDLGAGAQNSAALDLGVGAQDGAALAVGAGAQDGLQVGSNTQPLSEDDGSFHFESELPPQTELTTSGELDNFSLNQ